MGLWNKNKEYIEEEPEEVEEEDTDTYECGFEIRCSNCGEEMDVSEIPVGKRVKEYFANEKCENCGCLILDKEMDAFWKTNGVDE